MLHLLAVEVDLVLHPHNQLRYLWLPREQSLDGLIHKLHAPEISSTGGMQRSRSSIAGA